MDESRIDFSPLFTAKDAQQRIKAASELDCQIEEQCAKRRCCRENLAEFNYPERKRSDFSFNVWNAENAPNEGCYRNGNRRPLCGLPGACSAPIRSGCQTCDLNCACKSCETGIDRLIESIVTSPGATSKMLKADRRITVSESVLRRVYFTTIKEITTDICDVQLVAAFYYAKQVGFVEGYIQSSWDHIEMSHKDENAK